MIDRLMIGSGVTHPSVVPVTGLITDLHVVTNSGLHGVNLLKLQLVTRGEIGNTLAIVSTEDGI